jgi:prepilin-type N-terminal cleavage/methylation domain-containing protein
MRRIARGGMTLVELLVVITIIGVLGGIVALVAPRFQESTRVAEGARQFTNWLQIARQRAQRDKAPRGIRLSTNTLPPTLPPPDMQQLYNRFSYVEQPEDITGVPSEIILVPANLPLAQQITQTNTQRRTFGTYVASRLPASSPYQSLINSADGWKYLLWLQGRNLIGVVQNGDVVEFGGSRYRLVNDPVPYPTPNNAPDCVLVLHRMRDEARVAPDLVRSAPLPSYRITRSPRPIAGEPELTLPTNVAIDFVYPLNPNGARRSYPANISGGPAGFFDVVFSPSGEVIGGVGGNGRVIFWLRDVTLDSANPALAGQMPPGENRLVVLHCRNGQVSAHPVNPTLSGGVLSDPYSFVRDGKSSAAEDE